MKEKIEIGHIYLSKANKEFLSEDKIIEDLSILGFKGITFKQEKGFLANKRKIKINVSAHKIPDILENINFWRNKIMTFPGYRTYSINYYSLESLERRTGSSIAKELKIESIKKL